MIRYVVILLLSCSIWLNAQSEFYFFSAEVPDKLPINKEAISIQFPGDSTAFMTFFKKINETAFMGKNKVQIMHIGGSHVQADFWTNRLRQNFYSFFPGTKQTRGYFFPYKMAKSNNPVSYKVEYTGKWNYSKCTLSDTNYVWGLAGYEVHTTDTFTQIIITFSPDDYEYFTGVRIYYRKDSLSYEICPAAGNLLRENRQHRDYDEFIWSDPQDTIFLVITKTDTIQKRFQLFGIETFNNWPGIIVHSIGVNGASVPSYLSCKKFKDHYNQIKPDLVILSIGINDAYERDFSPERYKQNYDSLIAWLKEKNPDVQILLTTNNDSYYRRKYPNTNGELVELAMWELAQKYNAAYWDIFKIMGGLGSSRYWQKLGYMQADKIHFTRKGYELLGDMLFNALMQRYGEYLYIHRPLD